MSKYFPKFHFFIPIQCPKYMYSYISVCIIWVLRPEVQKIFSFLRTWFHVSIFSAKVRDFRHFWILFILIFNSKTLLRIPISYFPYYSNLKVYFTYIKVLWKPTKNSTSLESHGFLTKPNIVFFFLNYELIASLNLILPHFPFLPLPWAFIACSLPIPSWLSLLTSLLKVSVTRFPLLAYEWSPHAAFRKW